MKNLRVSLGIYFALFSFSSGLLAAPSGYIPDSSGNLIVPTNAAPKFNSDPGAPGGGGWVNVLTSPVASPSFLDMREDSEGYDTFPIPPNPSGAVGRHGTNSIFTADRMFVNVRNRSGSEELLHLDEWDGWAFWYWYTLLDHGELLDDPTETKVLYDPFFNNWIVACCSNELDPEDHSYLLLAVDDPVLNLNYNPIGDLYRQNFAIDANNNAFWAGDPTVGYNKDIVVVSVNLYLRLNNQFTNAQIYIFDKTNLYAGGTNYTLINLDPSYGSSIVPAVTYNTNISTLYLLQNYNGNTNVNGVTNGLLRLYTLQKNSTNLTATTNFPSCAKTWAFQPPGGMNFAPQLGITNKFQAGDARVQNVVYRNGSLWCAQTVFYPATAPTRSAIQWWQISTSGAPLQVGQLDDPTGTNFYAFPSIAVNQFSDVLVGYNHFASNLYASAAYSLHAYSDAPGTLEAGQTLKAGDGSYFCAPNSTHESFTADNGFNNLWGNYTATTVEPTNDIDFWTFQAYAATNAAGQSSNFWATWTGRISLPVPANDSFASAITLSGSQGSMGGTNIRATAESGEPVHAGTGSGASVWYQWTPSNTGLVEMDTTNASFDTVLAVYAGSALTNLNSIVSNDNIDASKRSQVSFTATNGSNYWIAVDGAALAELGSMGTFTLHWTQPDIPFIISQPRNWDVLAGSNITFSVSAIGALPLTFQWQWNGTNIASATDSTYIKNNVQTNDTGDYTLIVTNSHGSVTSGDFHLQVYDTATPTLSSQTFTGGQFQLTVSGVTNSGYVVDMSTNLVDWTTVATNIATFIYTNTVATNGAQFYRSRYHP